MMVHMSSSIDRAFKVQKCKTFKEMKIYYIVTKCIIDKKITLNYKLVCPKTKEV